jgi:uncharacterized protein YkwD
VGCVGEFTVLLAYRPVISFGRRGRALLVGVITVGALLGGGIAVAAPSAGQTSGVVTLTNQARREAGCPPLRTDSRLTNAAQRHANDMSRNGYFDHVSQDGRDFQERIQAAGYPEPGGENIAYGQATAQEVVTEWLNSPPHREIIETCELRTIGVGFAPNGQYWVQDFGN